MSHLCVTHAVTFGDQHIGTTRLRCWVVARNAIIVFENELPLGRAKHSCSAYGVDSILGPLREFGVGVSGLPPFWPSFPSLSRRESERTKFPGIAHRPMYFVIVLLVFLPATCRDRRGPRASSSREAYRSIGPYSTKTLHKNKQDVSYISMGDPYGRAKRDKNSRWSE